MFEAVSDRLGLTALPLTWWEITEDGQAESESRIVVVDQRNGSRGVVQGSHSIPGGIHTVRVNRNDLGLTGTGKPMARSSGADRIADVGALLLALERGSLWVPGTPCEPENGISKGYE